MSTLVSSLVNVLNSRSPFVVATADEEAASQTDTTTLTPSGIAARLSLTRAFLQYKEAEYLALHREIAQLRQELEADRGMERT